MRLDMTGIDGQGLDSFQAPAPRVTAEDLLTTYRISGDTCFALRDECPLERQTLHQVRQRYPVMVGNDQQPC